MIKVLLFSEEDRTDFFLAADGDFLTADFFAVFDGAFVLAVFDDVLVFLVSSFLVEADFFTGEILITPIYIFRQADINYKVSDFIDYKA